MTMMRVRVAADAEAEDIPGMQSMSAEGYASWLSSELFYLDPHDYLRASHGDYPIATTSEQVRILIEYLQSIEARMQAGGN